MSKQLLLYILFCLFSIPVFAQEPIHHIQYFNVSDGLIDRSVYAVVQDDHDFIWIGTANGLAKFDGRRFKKFGKNDSRLAGLINNIRKDHKGRLYVQSTTGIAVLDPISEKVVRFPEVADDFWNGANIIGSIDTKIYFVNNKGEIYFINEKDELVHFASVAPSKRRLVTISDWNSILFYHLTDLNNGHAELVEMDRNGKTLRKKKFKHSYGHFYSSCENKYYSFFKLERMREALSNSLLIREADKNSLYKYINFKESGKSIDFQKYCYENLQNSVNFIRDKDGNGLLSLNAHIFLFDKNENLQHYISKQLLEKEADNFGLINNLYRDRSKNLWIAAGNGLFMIRSEISPFRNYYNNNTGISVRGINELSDNRIIASTYHGIKIFDKHSKKELNTLDSLNQTLVNTIHSNNNIILGTHGKQIIHMDPHTLKINPIFLETKRFPHSNCPFYDSLNKVLYVGTNEGLFFQPATTEAIRPYNKTSTFDNIQTSEIHFFHQNSEGIWIISNNGLYLLDHQQGIIRQESMPHNNLKHLHEDELGNFWMASAGGGLIHWDREKGVKNQFTSTEGLSHDVIYAVYEDKNGFLWLPSNNGLMRFDKKNKEVVVFNKEYGIAHEEFNTYSHFQGKDGRLYFGGLNGITSFIPEELKPSSNDAPIVITSFLMYDSKTGGTIDRRETLLEKKEIILQPEDKFFTLEVNLLDYYSKYHSYAWRIKGLDGNWNYQREPNIRINTLPAGNYTMEVKAKGESGLWVKSQLSIPIHVLKPFYLRTPFLLTSILLALLTFGSAIYMRINSLKKRELKLQQIVSERTSELSVKNKELEEANQSKDKMYAIIAHDLRAPASALQNVGSKINYLTSTKQQDRLQSYGNTIDQSITALCNLLDNLLKWANQNLKNIYLEPQELSLQALFDQVIKSQHLLIAKKGLNIHNELVNGYYVYADQQTVQTIIRNLIANAIKFTPENGSITIKSRSEKDHIFIDIIDTGIGIKEAHLLRIFDKTNKIITTGTAGEPGTGLGLTVSKELAQLNKGDIFVQSKVNHGSTFSLRLPSGSRDKELNLNIAADKLKNNL